MARPVKCPHCGKSGDRDNMNSFGKRWYCKGECSDIKQRDDEFKEKEWQEWDELFQYIMKLHGLIEMPKPVITRLQDMRNGYIVERGKRYKSKKGGHSYSLMLEAYKLADKSIQWAIKSKLDNSKDTGSIMYCMSIMIGQLNVAQDIRDRKKRVLQINQAEKTKNMEDNLDINYIPMNNSKKEDSMDISKFL